MGEFTMKIPGLMCGVLLALNVMTAQANTGVVE